jgi:hypothetical protein
MLFLYALIVQLLWDCRQARRYYATDTADRLERLWNKSPWVRELAKQDFPRQLVEEHLKLRHAPREIAHALLARGFDVTSGTLEQVFKTVVAKAPATGLRALGLTGALRLRRPRSSDVVPDDVREALEGPRRQP